MKNYLLRVWNNPKKVLHAVLLLAGMMFAAESGERFYYGFVCGLLFGNFLEVALWWRRNKQMKRAHDEFFEIHNAHMALMREALHYTREGISELANSIPPEEPDQEAPPPTTPQ